EQEEPPGVVRAGDSEGGVGAEAKRNSSRKAPSDSSSKRQQQLGRQQQSAPLSSKTAQQRQIGQIPHSQIRQRKPHCCVQQPPARQHVLHYWGPQQQRH